MRNLVPIGLSLFLALTGCGDGGRDIVGPTTGTLEITTTTGGEGGAPGPDIDVQEYTVSVDGGAAQPIGINETLILSGISAGAHTVQLGGLPDGCTVGAGNPRGVTVTAGDTSSVDFGITCVPPAGVIQGVTATTRAPAGYELKPGGVSQGTIGSATARRLEGSSLALSL